MRFSESLPFLLTSHHFSGLYIYIYALALIVNSRASFSRRIGRIARDDYSQTCAQKERENYGSRTDEAAAVPTSRISSASLLARVRSFCRSSPSFSLFFLYRPLSLSASSSPHHLRVSPRLSLSSSFLSSSNERDGLVLFRRL